MDKVTRSVKGKTMGKNDIIKILQDYKKEVAEQYNILKVGIKQLDIF